MTVGPESTSQGRQRQLRGARPLRRIRTAGSRAVAPRGFVPYSRLLALNDEPALDGLLERVDMGSRLSKRAKVANNGAL